MERVAVLHVDARARVELVALVEARGIGAIGLDSLEALADAAARTTIALLMVDARTLREVGLEALQDAALGDRPYGHVPVVLLATRDDPALESASSQAVDELLWEPVDGRELVLRVESGLARRRTTDVVAVASHELRSPVHAIVAFLDLLGRSDLPAPQREMVEGARTASRHLVDLVEDLLEHARLGQAPVVLDAAPFSLRAVVREASSIALDAAAPGHVSIDATFAAALPGTLRGDGPRVRQILINLLSNALKFAVAEPVRLRVGYADGQVDIEVADDGPGVPEPARALVFEPFRQADPSIPRRFGGTGLGLAIARSLARRMDGDVIVRSAGEGDPMRGAVFVAQLRLDACAAPANEPEGRADTRPLALVADADALHRAILVPLLERIGYRVDIASEGVAALLHALEHRPALVVVDLALPVLGGLDVARRLRAADVTIPIVGFVREANDTVRAEASAAGFQALVAKPVAPLQLQRALRQASARAHAAPARAIDQEADDRSGARERLAISSQIRDAIRGIVDAVERHASTLDVAIANQDLGLAAEITRILRGAIVTLDARGLEQVLRDLEQAARAGDREETRRAHEVWRAAVAVLRQDVERFLTRDAAHA